MKVCRNCGRVLARRLRRDGSPIQTLYPWWCPSCMKWFAKDQVVVKHEEIGVDVE